MSSTKKSVIRRQKKSALRAARRKEITARRKHNLGLTQIPRKDMASCNEFYTLALNTVRENMKITAYAQQLLQNYISRLAVFQNDEVTAALTNKVDTSLQICRMVDTADNELMLQFGKVEDTTTNFDRMQLIVGLLPMVKRTYEIREALRHCVLELGELVTAKEKGTVTLDAVNKLTTPDVEAIDKTCSDLKNMADSTVTAMSNLAGLNKLIDPDVADDAAVFDTASVETPEPVTEIKTSDNKDNTCVSEQPAPEQVVTSAKSE